MAASKITEILRLLDNLLQSQKIDRDTASLLTDLISVHDIDSNRLDKALDQIAHLTNETNYLSDSIQVLQTQLLSQEKVN